MYRIVYRYSAASPMPGEWREVQFATNYALAVYERWLRRDDMTDVRLDTWRGGAWHAVRSGARDVRGARQ